MDILTIDKLILFLYFFVPGFISMKFYRFLIAEENTDFSKNLYEAIGISCINFPFFFWIIYFINQPEFLKNHQFLYYLITICIIFITPILLTWGFYKLLISRFFRKRFINPVKIPWDWHFSKRESYWVIVTLKDGKKIGGKYGLDSKVSAYPRPKEIYIQDIWKLDKNGKFIESIQRNVGVLILEDNILAIEFFK